MSRLLPRICAAIAALVLVIGAAVILLGNLSPQSAWEASSDTNGAPADVITAADIVDARRAAGEAGTQATFLVTGTNQLVDGVNKLSDGAKDLGPGVHQLSDGANQLSKGLVEIQAGTGQLGRGATELADGVDKAVDSLVGLMALRGQLITALDGVQQDVEKSLYPNKKELLDQIQGFRAQVDNLNLEGSMQDDLERMRKGSRDLANQLAVPGYAYHDGIYSATKGAKELAAALGEANSQVDGAVDGIKQLQEGSEKLNGMAENNKQKITAVQRAIPAVQVQDKASEAAKPALAPTSGFLLAALVMLAGAVAGMLGWKQGLAVCTATVAATTVLFAILAANATVLSVGMVLLVAALLSAASAGLTLLCTRFLGGFLGGILAMVGVLVQLGLVGWVWKTATTEEIPTVLQALAGLMPLHYGSAAVTALGNAGDPRLLWGGVLVLAVVAAAALAGVGGGMLPRRQSEPVYPAVDDAPTGEFPPVEAEQ